MTNETVLAAIKAGMKSELDSVATYEGAASAAGPGEVGTFLREMAEEEKKHFDWLLAFYQDLSEGAPPRNDPISEGEGARGAVVTEDFLRRVGASREVSAAISAAILLEANGIRHYRASAEETANPGLRSFYEKLAAWEEKHYHDLLRIQEDSERFYWDAARWEPF